ncbi:glycoside hydrolase family 18 protein [Chengkuizengella axinellae]|uniref:Glycoside hydrolase family 18 protein n=1 Tax=Chengkuizengella axinellae TaxID=3064388 RepID=A0ABT9J1R4_9BACL|nr:glycoside hydrolase family 18 protein [Chengkuizengella sp. 2205SS18-9]MDP5275556.1 glycoside hydrolase family 18 protein [Chengkuizengella sp. 2205SS18-9]
MQIHVVESGDSLNSIANTYSISPNQIASANQVSETDPLVIGQSLVIPIQGSYYWVQSGDSMSSIAQKFGMNQNTLAQTNEWPIERELPVGFRLYIPQKPKSMGVFNAYIEPSGDAFSEVLQNAARESAPYLTYLAPFSYHANRDGSLTPPQLDDLASIAAEDGATLMMVISNLEEGQFSAELGEIILNNEDVQDNLLNNIISVAKEQNFKDIHFDFEFLRPEDREAYNQFLRKAADRIHQEGFLISTALAPKTSAEQTGAWYTAHDYKAHGEIVDFVVIMSYEWGYSGGPPMPVSPITEVRKVLEYAISEIPSNKILMGQNLYGYDWTLPFEPGGDYAKALSPQAAISLARERNVPIQYDYTEQAPFIDYKDDEGQDHKVWFEDARSIQAKFNLLKELQLRGMSYWKLGLAFPQNWLLIDDNFNVIKMT